MRSIKTLIVIFFDYNILNIYIILLYNKKNINFKKYFNENKVILLHYFL